MNRGDLDQAFAPRLLAWYDEHARELPWRATSDPYAILVSEFMLQQTQVSTVIPYYAQFLERFPTVWALADASEEETLAAWKGLGYYQRARRLRQAAQAIVAQWDGRVPADLESLKSLPGVGAYTAAAVASIAFGFPAPVVDGNVLRVMARALAVREPIERSSARARIADCLERRICRDRPGDFNQAMMELGATLCRPTAPQCERCPVAFACLALEKGLVDELPARLPKSKPRVERRTVGVIVAGDRVLMARRPEIGLLAGMWEFPNVKGQGEAGKAALSAWFQRRFGRGLDACERVGKVSHLFSHLRWDMDVTLLHLASDEVREGPGTEETLAWTPVDSVDELAVPTAMQKVWDAAKKRMSLEVKALRET